MIEINDNLTDKEYWNNYWTKINIPLEIKRTKRNNYLNAVLDVFDKYLPKNPNLSILEVGGSPAKYLIYMNKTFGYRVSSLDYSELGCKLSKKNFKLFKINGKVFHKDLFSKNLNLPKFDIVFSIGVIEHFKDLNNVIKKHLDLIKPKGILIISCPSFLGVNKWILKRLSPYMLSLHNLKTMDISSWKIFEKKFNLKILFRGYIGGFEPSIFHRLENKKLCNQILFSFLKFLRIIFHFNIFKRFNHKYFSGYLIGVYRVL